jgi:ADP-heptose:LPS heptosyltransferase
VRILVIRRDNIGDLVCTTPLLAALRERYPKAHIAALVNSYNAGVLDGNCDIDAVHVYTKLKHRVAGQSALRIVLARFRMLRELRRAPFDYIVLASASFNPHALRFARQLHRRHIVGFANGDEPGAKPITIRVPALPYAELHEVQILQLLAQALDVPRADGPLRVFPQAEQVQAWQRRVPALRTRERPWVAVHISAREPERQWPAAQWSELIRGLASTGVGVLVVWAPGPESDPRHPGDDDKAARVLAAAADNPLIQGAPTRTIGELIGLLSLCQGFVGADGGAMHVAAALGLPMAVLFEGLGTKPNRWHPWKVPYELLASRTRNVSDVSAAQLLEAWRLLAQRLRLAANTPGPIASAAHARE